MWPAGIFLTFICCQFLGKNMHKHRTQGAWKYFEDYTLCLNTFALWRNQLTTACNADASETKSITNTSSSLVLWHEKDVKWQQCIETVLKTKLLFGANGWLCHCDYSNILTGLICHGWPGQKHGVQGDDGGLKKTWAWLRLLGKHTNKVVYLEMITHFMHCCIEWLLCLTPLCPVPVLFAAQRQQRPLCRTTCWS